MTNSTKIGKHDKYACVYLLKDHKTQEITYEAKVTINRRSYSKLFTDAEKAKKYVDLKCIEKGVPQKNNSYGRKD